MKRNKRKQYKKKIKQSSHCNQPHFDTLPQELIVLIAGYLNLQEMAQLASVNKNTYCAVYNTPCAKFGIWDTHANKLRLATFKEITEDTNDQIEKRKKADEKYDKKLKELKAQRQQLRSISNCTDNFCTQISTVIMLMVTGITGSVLTAIKLDKHETNEFEIVCSVVGFASFITAGTIGTFFAYQRISDACDRKIQEIYEEINEQKQNGKQRLYDETPSKLVQLR